MSLYNQLFGTNEDAPILLGMINVNKEYFDRFRDVELIKNGTIIRVFTRLGGENREVYVETWNKILQHKMYLIDYDDDFDETYAYIEFKVPEKYIETTKKMFKVEPISFKEKFSKELEKAQIPGTEANQRMEAMVQSIVAQIQNSDEDENITFLYL